MTKQTERSLTVPQAPDEWVENSRLNLSDEALRALRAYGLDTGQLEAPAPPLVTKYNLDELCVEPLTLRGFQAASQPMVYLGYEDRVDGTSRFEGYQGFSVITAIHPEHGEIVITTGIPESGESQLLQHVRRLAVGQLFRVGMLHTAVGNRMFKAIPVTDQK